MFIETSYTDSEGEVHTKFVCVLHIVSIEPWTIKNGCTFSTVSVGAIHEYNRDDRTPEQFARAVEQIYTELKWITNYRRNK